MIVTNFLEKNKNFEKEVHKVRSRLISTTLNYVSPKYKDEWINENEISKKKSEINRKEQEVDLDKPKQDMENILEIFSKLLDRSIYRIVN